MYVHLEDNRLRMRVVCHAYVRIYDRYSHPHIQYTFACLRYPHIRARNVVTEGSDYVGRRVRIFGHTHTHTSLWVYVCLKFMCTRLHHSIAQPKGGTRGSSRRAVQASCYDFQNRKAQWPRSAPDKIVIIIVLAMAGIEERHDVART